MKNKFIIKTVVLLALSTSLFAIQGPHKSVVISDGVSDNAEICVYCHTPHASRIGGPIPLWNKPGTNLEAINGFKMYGATTANTVTAQQPQNQTLACLSCHDGVSAMNSVINAPGTGNVYPDGVLIGTPTDARTMYDFNFLAVGLNGDLTDDHPVSIEYIEGKASLRPITDTTDFYGATYISDLLRNGRVECVSCHDPHGTAGLPRYLRKLNDNSGLCFGCHDK
ncbi:cytochrome c3 family protein [Sulfurimonas sp. CS5]|jgi:predicted CXXCH cytochrome family protein|uniref:cytochrome c3 family protein n=1 Tax=Sulfurimonas sp. CS5 TaxID=3391145 RepID=UPI0039ECC592